MNTNTRQDPLAHASEIPDVAALIRECETAMNMMNLNGETPLARLQRAETVQFNRRAGKSRDGKKNQQNFAGKVIRPYDGCPDSDIHTCDELVLGITDVLCMGREMAQIGVRSSYVTKASAAATAELRAVAEFCQRATSSDRANSVELAAQMTAKLGWCVRNPGWRERWELVERELDLESFINQVAQDFGPENALKLSTAILDPTLEAEAVNVIGQLFAYVPKSRRAKIVRELREDGQTTFLDRQRTEARPTDRTLIPGYNYFVLGAPGELARARGHLVIERLTQADLESIAASEGWNEAFVEAVLATMGQYSSMSDGMRQKAESLDGPSHDLSVEIWTTCIYQFDEELAAAGWYYTVFSPHVSPAKGETGKADFARHFLLSYACGAPFIESRLMVEGPAVDDSRGVPEMVETDQAIMKMLQDAVIARAHLEVDPPRAFIGFGNSIVENWNAPGAAVKSIFPGGDVKELGPTRGSPQVGEAALERIEAGTRRRFALPNNTDGSHPSAWQTRQLRLVKRFLTAEAEVLTQQVVLCYQELEAEELAQIIGHWPQLSLADVLQHRITLSFDVRGLDADWRNDLVQMVMQLLGIDRGATINTDAAVQLLGSAFDPALISAIVRDPAEANEAVYDKVSNDVLEIMTGNPPRLSDRDASAGMQLKAAIKIIGMNDKYKEVLARDEKTRENLKAYVESLQHSVQETQMSPVQGRTGVAQLPQRPVSRGPGVE